MSQIRENVPSMTFAEFFAGIGLMRIGLENAGWQIRFANDLDPMKEKIYREHFKDGESHFVLEDIHQTLYKRAFDASRSRVQDVKTVGEIKEFYTSGQQGYVKAPVALLQDQSYEAVKKDNSLSSRCLPFEDEGQKVLIGKSY